MKKTLLLVTGLFTLCTLNAQIRVSETLNGPDVNGELFSLSGDPMDLDIGKSLYVTNESQETLTMKVRRLEEDVTAGTANNICWFLCPAISQTAGENPDWLTELSVTLAPGQVDSSFSIHYEPNGQIGCSLFNVQWVDAAHPAVSFSEANFRMVHGSEDCATVGLDDVEIDLDMSLTPNPSNDLTILSIENLERMVEIEILDVLGKTVMQEMIQPSPQARVNLNTSAMRNGIYFLSVSDGARTLRTVKLVVKH
jgi:hypothetical protein